MNPYKVFGALVAVMAALAAAALLTRPVEPALTQPHPTPTAASPEPLTEAEAIARFKELKLLRDRAYRRRDPSLLPRIYSEDSRAAMQVADELAQLKTDNVFDRTTFKTLSVRVISRKNNRVVLEQEVIVRPKVVSEAGKDVTVDGRPELRTVRWILQRDKTGWFLFRNLIVAARSTKP